MTSPANLKSAQDFCAELHRALEEVPFYRTRPSVAEHEARILKLRAVIALVEGKGGHVDDKWSGAAIRIFGFRATSTSGLEGACRNWIAQVTLKSMAAQ